MDSHLDNPASHTARDQDSKDVRRGEPAINARARINTNSNKIKA